MLILMHIKSFGIQNKVNSSICSCSITVSILALLRVSAKASVLAKIELFWFDIEVSMLLILLKGYFVQYKTGGN